MEYEAKKALTSTGAVAQGTRMKQVDNANVKTSTMITAYTASQKSSGVSVKQAMTTHGSSMPGSFPFEITATNRIKPSAVRKEEADSHTAAEDRKRVTPVATETVAKRDGVEEALTTAKVNTVAVKSAGAAKLKKEVKRVSFAAKIAEETGSLAESKDDEECGWEFVDAEPVEKDYVVIRKW
ncbi:hypothetical protein LTR85_009889 [Meristemomyces frigidus]|nr:hypothetical protein LTR85_009889 [Meristemomyces frigidus]